MMKRNLLAMAVGSALALPAFAAGTNELDTLRADLERMKAQNAELATRVDALATTAVTTESASRSTFGGYGELHYNNLNNKGTGADKQEMDFHRFVLFFGHQFSDNIRFFSEFELEHALSADGAAGEVELEQAFLEFTLSDTTRAAAGVLLMPVGIINETHEPNTFYGVERNAVEKNIIPATWWEGGAMLSHQFGAGFSADAAVTSGLNTTAANSYAVRKGRQKVSEAQAKNLAYTGRLKWTGMPGVELATTLSYQSDITQGNDPAAGAALLAEAHAVIEKGPFGLRALYATWQLDGAGPESIGADEQTGWYVEPSYKVNPKLGVFARYSTWDNQAGDDTDSEYAQTSVGVNYWPHPDVVLKADYQSDSAPAGKSAFRGFNLGLGYQF